MVYLPSTNTTAPSGNNNKWILVRANMLLPMWSCRLLWHAPTVGGSYDMASYYHHKCHQQLSWSPVPYRQQTTKHRHYIFLYLFVVKWNSSICVCCRSYQFTRLNFMVITCAYYISSHWYIAFKMYVLRHQYLDRLPYPISITVL